MNWLHHILEWVKMYHVTVGCAVFTVALLIIPHDIAANWLKDHYFNQYLGINLWATALVPFLSAMTQLVYNRVKFRKRLTSKGKRFHKSLIEEYHIPAFYLIDSMAVVCLILGLLVIYYPDAAKPEYHQIHVFEVFANIFIAPFISIINYYSKVKREESKPNFVINHPV